MSLSRVLLVWQIAFAGAALAAEPELPADCEALDARSREELLALDFEAEQGLLKALPAERRYRLARVNHVRQPVFPDAEGWLERSANRYHWQTRKWALDAAFIVDRGEMVDRRELAEAERVLRGKAFLYDARVVPRALCPDGLVIDVVTRDVWTLIPIAAAELAGGDAFSALGVTNPNWFGFGKGASLQLFSGEDREGVAVGFSDPNVMASRWQLGLQATDADDGHFYSVDLSRPFFALNTQRALRFYASDFEREEGLFLLNSEVWEFDARSKYAEAELGFSRGVVDRRVWRYAVGVAMEQDRFDFPLAYPFTPAQDRDERYPFVRVSLIEDRFDTRLNLDRVQRTEDIGVGLRFGARLGWSNPAWGADGDRLVGNFNLSDGAWTGDRQLVQYGVSGRADYDLEADRFDDVLATARVDYRFNHAPQFTFSARGSYTLANNLPVDRQLLLGGARGLRGYPTRYQAGDRRFLLTVEERYYSNLYPFGLFRLGGVLFADVGRAWFEDDPPDWIVFDRSDDAFDTLSNVGVGLRLESTRTRRDVVLHLDFAVPVVDGPNVSAVEVTLTAKSSL